MGPIQSITTCLRKSFDFSGRATRAEFWWFAPFWLFGGQLAGFITSFPIAFYYSFQAGRAGVPMPLNELQLSFTVGFWATLAVYVLLTVPLFAVMTRRLHDAGYRGVGILTILLFIVGAIAGLGAYHLSHGASPALAGQMTGFRSPLILILAPFSKTWSLTRPSTPGPNRYGPNPLEVSP